MGGGLHAEAARAVCGRRGRKEQKTEPRCAAAILSERCCAWTEVGPGEGPGGAMPSEVQCGTWGGVQGQGGGWEGPVSGHRRTADYGAFGECARVCASFIRREWRVNGLRRSVCDPWGQQIDDEAQRCSRTADNRRRRGVHLPDPLPPGPGFHCGKNENSQKETFGPFSVHKLLDSRPPPLSSRLIHPRRGSFRSWGPGPPRVVPM